VSIRYPIKRKLFSEFTASVRKDETLWLIDHNASGIVTSGGAVTAWTNSGTGGSAYDMDVLLGTGGLRRHDSGAVLLDGVSGSYVSTPDSPAASVTGDITLIAYAALDDWTPPTDDRVLVSKWNFTGSTQSYFLRVSLTTGKIELSTSTTGANSTTSSSSIAPNFIDGSGHWVRVTLDISANTANYYTSDDAPTTAYDAITWTQLGDPDVAHFTASIFDSTAPVEIGSRNAGDVERLSGQVFRACVIASTDPTATPSVDFDARLAGLTAGAGDTFFGAEMLTPSARTINATDWTRGGSGFITDNGDGTVTLSDTDNGGSVAAWVNDNIVANDSTKIKLTVTIKEGTALETDIRLTYTGGTTVSAQYRYTWATGVLSTISAGVSGEAAVNSDGSVTVTVVAQNNSTGNTTCTPRLYPATSLGSTQGSTIFYNNVSLQAEWTLNGGAKIQNSGQAVVQAGGVGGIETTVAPANIPTPMTMFMVGKADLLNGGVFTAARNDSSAGPFIQATIATFNFNAGSVITKTSDTGFHLHTVRHNGDATTSYQIDSGTPVVGDAGAEPYNFGTFFSDLAAGSKLTGSMGRFVLKADTTNSLITERVQQQLKRKHGL